jgi:drug/metabolite transporter (DMT)-like permease
MQRHHPSGRWRLGLGLSLLTVFLWGLLPIALQITLKEMDGYTITWYRFTAASVLLGSYLTLRGGLPGLRGQGSIVLILLAVVTLGLGGNYVLYILGLSYTSAGSAQVLIQLAPAMAMLGALVVFQERFVKAQWLGLFVLASGMALFFNNRLGELLAETGDYSLGMLLILLAAIAWAIYALAQKQLLSVMSSAGVMFVIYAGSTLLLFPVASPQTVLALGTLPFWLLVFAAFNTLIAYGAFAEALAHWEASRVNAVLSLTPIATLLMIRIGSALWPEVVASEPLNLLSGVGATLVVAGSMTIALAQAKKSVPPRHNYTRLNTKRPKGGSQPEG